jgi:excinuclease UvrABC nuclease subunit
MESAAKELDFIEAARIRDIIKTIEKNNTKWHKQPKPSNNSDFLPSQKVFPG